ncbi:unnamed protein product, partial [Brenthis ino]
MSVYIHITNERHIFREYLKEVKSTDPISKCRTYLAIYYILSSRVDYDQAHGCCGASWQASCRGRHGATLDIPDNPVIALVHHSLKAVARSCMQQVNATESDLMYLRKDPPYPEKAACIMSCLLVRIGLIKDDKYSKEGFMNIVNPLVFHSKKKLEHLKDVSETCDKEVINQEDVCKLASDIVACIYQYAPELHFKG